MVSRVDKTMGLLGLARRAGMLVIGEEAAGISARAGKVCVLFLADDASGNAEKRALSYAADRLPLLRLPYSKEELSRALGKAGCSMAAVTDPGFACGIVEALSVMSESSDGAVREIQVLGGKPGGVCEVLDGLRRKYGNIRDRKSDGPNDRTGMNGRK